MQKRILVNNQIRAPEVRLIDETGKQIGIVSLREALEFAQAKQLDLIQVTEKVSPPVCKLGNYGKFLYQLEKKERKGKKQAGGELKEIRLTFGISPHDIETKIMQAQKFLSRGDIVKVSMPLKGRERALQNFAKEKIENFLSQLGSKLEIKIEKELKTEPGGLVTIISKGK